MSGKAARRAKGYLFWYFNGNKWAVCCPNMPRSFTMHRSKRGALNSVRCYRKKGFEFARENSQP